MERNTNTLYILRFIAALTVVFYHFAPHAMQMNLIFFVKSGGEAVNFFFFISGFVLIISNTKSYFANPNNSFSITTFYIKRIARIYPLYVFALLALAVFHYGIHSIDTNTVKYRLPFEFLGIQRWLYAGSFNSPGWTISCEFFFYLLFPFIIVYMRKNMRGFTLFVLAYFFIAILISATLNYILKQHLPPIENRVLSSLYKHPIFLISTFLFGMLGGKIYMENKITFFKGWKNNFLAVIISIMAISLIKYYADDELLASGILAPLYFILVTSITSFTKNQTVIFSYKPVIFLGEISFGIYILQAPVQRYFTYFFGEINNTGTMMLFVFTLITIASITYYIIEIPAKKFILNSYYHLKGFKKPIETSR